MAPNRTFSATNEIVIVSSSEPNKGQFNIHKQLLENNTRFVEIKRNDAGALQLKIDASYDAIHCFSQWLYHDIHLGDVRELPDKIGHGDLLALLEIHALGRKVGCFDFMDMVLDAIIDILTENPFLCPKIFIKVFASEFPPNSGGWKLAIEVLLRWCQPECDMNECVYEYGLCEIDDQALITQLARRISAIEKFKKVDNVENPRYTKILVNGYFNLSTEKGEIVTRTGPRLESGANSIDTKSLHCHATHLMML